MNIEYTITEENIIPANLQIFNSYSISKYKFHDILKEIRNEHPKSEVWNRKEWLMHLEWALHNLFYVLYIARSHTKDVDLNYPQCFIIKVIYTIFGAIAWIFIK